MTSTILLLLAVAADGWGPPAVVTHDDQPCVSYRAQVSGGYISVEVKLEKGWHTFTMDNDKRAAAKLAGKKALSSDKPTSLQAVGLEITGPWLQSPPKDFSQPDLRIFSWGYEGSALFAAPAKVIANSASIRIKGQACTPAVCKNIDTTVEAPIAKAGSPPPLAGMIRVE